MRLEHFEQHLVPQVFKHKTRTESYNYRRVKFKGSARMRRGKIPGRLH